MNEKNVPKALDDSVDEFCYTLAFNLRRVLGVDEKEEIDDESADD